MKFHTLVQSQRDYFLEGNTKTLEFRLSMLHKLQSAIKENEKLINALQKCI